MSNPALGTSLLWTVCFVPGEENPDIFSKFNWLNMDTPLKQTHSMATVVSSINGV